MQVYTRRTDRFNVERYGVRTVARRRARARHNWSVIRDAIHGRRGNVPIHRRIRSRIRWLKLRRVQANALAIRALRRVYPKQIVKQIYRFL